MKILGRAFFKGLLTLAPVLLTIYVVYWTAVTAEGLLGKAIRLVVPAESYVPGMGIAAGVAAIILVGFLLQAWIFGLLFSWGERLLEKVPLVKSLYSSIKDMLSFFGGGEGKKIGQVVAVELGEPKVKLLGFVTREDMEGLPEGLGGGDLVGVYLPMSYQIGGITAFFPRSALTPLDMTTEEALRFAVTAGAKAGKIASKEGG
ncbi:MAG TPA: DUF502 domain-containing protein [Planctomycetes bacterium]|nr:DUF502 domain-containing protein [Planctomycetota bacterium]